MKIFIPSYNRPTTHSTYHLLAKNGIPSKVVVHTEQYADYLKNGVPAGDLVVSGTHTDLNNLAKHRNWIIENLVEEGEWHIQMSDDAESFSWVVPELYNHESIPKEFATKEMFGSPFNFLDFSALVFEIQQEAEKKKAYYAGFAITKNHFYRTKKWQYRGLVDGRFILIKKSELRYDENVHAIDDYQFSAANLLRFGVIVRNNFFCPDFKRYGTGGIGNQEQRFEKKKQDCEYLLQKYPFIFKVHKARKSKYSIDLSFQPVNIEKWRFAMRNLKK